MFSFSSLNRSMLKSGVSDSEGKAYVVFSRKPRLGHEGAP